MKSVQGFLRLFFVTLIIAGIALTVNAQVTFKGTKKLIPIGKGLEYYIDTTSKLTVIQIASHIKFLKSNSNIPDFGLLKSPVWLRISISNKSADSSLILKFDQSLLQECSFYYLENGVLKHNTSGELYPFKSRFLNYHNLIYGLNIRHDSTAVYYFRIRSSHQMQFPVFLGTKAYIENINLTKNILFGIFTGVILVMFFYNLFIYFSVKDKVYLYYVILHFSCWLATDHHRRLWV